MVTKPRAQQRDISVALAYGKNWFINWADFPSVAAASKGYSPHGQILFYHFLQYSAEGTYDYDVMYNLNDGGGGFYDYKKLHQDTVSAEHGFLSSAPLPDGGLQVTWLDGRFTKEAGEDAGANEGSEGHGHGSGGAMTLRTKELSADGSVELDHRVCDCCNTATVATDSLVMVAYRDRSEHEIRDIAYVIKPNGEDWSTPKLVHADNWEISGCPVNGPALAGNAAGEIAIVWYTAANDKARLNFARYDRAADAFSPPLLLDGNDPLGRVDIQLADDGTAYVSGLTTNDATDDARLTLWTIAPNGDMTRETLAPISAARSSGFPKIALFQDQLFWAWTVVGEKKGDQYVEVCRRGI